MNVMLPQRFWDKVQQVGDDPIESCWEWQGYRMKGGYGQIGMGKKVLRVHRLAWEEMFGPIPEGLHLDHLCRNPPCLNPFHVDPVTPKVNSRRGVGGQRAAERQLRKTHCPKGHPYDEENTYIMTHGGRTCRVCNRAAQRVYQARKKAERDAQPVA